MSTIAVSASHLGKLYKLSHQKGRPGGRSSYRRFSDVMISAARAPLRQLRRVTSKPSPIEGGGRFEDFWALKDVSFEINQGEAVGIIGRNGAGKSTLLKLLSRITLPTRGQIELDGRVASLLEVGTGFHPELTGRENIFLNGAILGMTRGEIRRKFEEIVAFAESERFLDTPVKHYSSGMYVRLAFAVAAHLEPEILIVDEVLAVGDLQFQKKCLGKMNEVAHSGRTVLFVSHNMGAVSTLTQRCIYLESGNVAATGKSRDIVEMYLMRAAEPKGSEGRSIESYRRRGDGDAPVVIRRIGVRVGDRIAEVSPQAEIGAKAVLEIELDVRRPLQGAIVDLLLKNSHGERVSVLLSSDRDFRLSLPSGTHLVEVRLGSLPLAPGYYFADVGVTQSENAAAYDVILDYPLFSVVNNGQVTNWLDRPWGMLHSQTVEWSTQSAF